MKKLAKQGLDRSKIHITIDVDSKDANKGKYLDLSKGRIENVRIECDEDEDEDDRGKGTVGIDKGIKGKLRKKAGKTKNRKSKDVSETKQHGKGRKKLGEKKARKENSKKSGRNKQEKGKAKKAKRKGKQRKEEKQRKENKSRKESKGKVRIKKGKKKRRKSKKTKFLPNPEGSPNPDGLKIPLTFHREEIHETKNGSSLNKQGVDGLNSDMGVVDIKDDDNSKHSSDKQSHTSNDINGISKEVDSNSNAVDKDSSKIVSSSNIADSESNKVDNSMSALDKNSNKQDSHANTIDSSKGFQGKENGLKSNEPNSQLKPNNPNDDLNMESVVDAQASHKLRDITKEIIITALKEVHSMSQNNASGVDATLGKGTSMSSPLEIKMVSIILCLHISEIYVKDAGRAKFRNDIKTCIKNFG